MKNLAAVNLESAVNLVASTKALEATPTNEGGMVMGDGNEGGDGKGTPNQSRVSDVLSEPAMM